MGVLRTHVSGWLLVGALLAGLLAGTVWGAGPVRVVDALGQNLVFPTPPHRIVSLAPSVTEILYAIGAQALVVGVSGADDYPSEVRRKPKVGGVQLDYERLAALRPDLVVGILSLQRANLERLRALGYRVLALDPRSVVDTHEAILLLGRVTGRVENARRVVDGMQGRTERIRARVLRSASRPRVFVEVWDQPFLTAGRGTFVHDLLELAGGVNVFRDLAGWPEVSEEEILRRNPEVILLLHPGRNRVLQRPAWRVLPAVRSGRIHVLNPSWVTRPGPRLVLGLEQIARFLHPEARKREVR
ncbi:MAG: ABC transporter substrate-binding protein [Armatimonadota bacterium]|nr:ABC transporter substrate-binding protein [Armatimonadota bacterium]MDR7439362.1 ABC transporter substrate-binding protein [Armatimonadota bacterium]MDR7563201.1 ABC transporter substrate-binding protein [Armatimonadota bacterium]MDR7567384.1 ABC transporter substrate-binding protein [Armatimonadota bacterium]MDR7601895.1 ABC transporter substrate-binding protein [Armatimonadota bacterium]